MRERQPPTQTITAADVPARWSDLVERVARQEARVVVEEGGRPVAAVVSAEDFAQLQQVEAQRAERLALLATMRERFADLSEEQIEEDVARVVAEVRAEARDAATPRTA